MEYAALYRAGRQRLEEAGVPDADLDARLLLEAVTGEGRNTLLAHGDKPVSGEQEAEYEQFLAKRAQRVPLQYITGRQSFMGLAFLVNENVLIPRQDTEILVEEVMREPYDGSRILDLCTGSGCILLSLLHYSNDCSGLGLDISTGAVETAKENARLLDMEERAVFLQSDLLEKAEGSFDIITANPPYIRTDVIETLMPEVRDYEPALALDGGAEGLHFYRRILTEAVPYIKGGTRLYFEIGFDQGESVSRLMEEAGFTDVTVVKDYAGCDRVVKGVYRGA
ncbi:MAG: peptide chain release factor N(5)-glutamine methyltransferase [Lachnospiraceae bacterium]|nr:peptide chain release factor N(5)-glutamine methyltransferase [Lachnospiraceae bacterium]